MEKNKNYWRTSLFVCGLIYQLASYSIIAADKYESWFKTRYDVITQII